MKKSYRRVFRYLLFERFFSLRENISDQIISYSSALDTLLVLTKQRIKSLQYSIASAMSKTKLIKKFCTTRVTKKKNYIRKSKQNI
jgi:hypothetical protein